MPKTISGEPIDEDAWERAKRIAEKQGEGGNYAYITGVYKQMKNLDKGELDKFEESFEKSFVESSESGYNKNQTKVVIYKSPFTDVRCSSCHTKLLRMRKSLTKSKTHSVEVKCRKCGEINRV